MYCWDRPAIQNFDNNELLYRRCEPGMVDVVNNRALASAFSFPGNARLSVNRGLFSEPGDCRYPNRHHDYVVQFRVGEMPPSIQAENGGTLCHFGVVHDPIREDKPPYDFENYGHSEIRVYRNATRADADQIPRNNKLPDTVKLEFRQALADKSRIAQHPNPELND
jgi:hypothetical protein